MPIEDPHIGRVAQRYDTLAHNGPYGTLAPSNQGGRKSRYVAEVFDAALVASLQRGTRYDRLVDFGCGTGIFTRKAARVAHEVIGFDISRGMLEQARHFCAGLDNVYLRSTDGIHIALPDESADVAVTREVLCYVPDDHLGSVLVELHRVTRRGGRFLWLDQVSNNPCWQRHPGAPNLVKRSSSSIRKAAEDAGWEVTSERIVRTPRFPWIYPVWFGLVPQSLTPVLARWEVALHAGLLCDQHPHRWWDALFELRKPVHG